MFTRHDRELLITMIAQHRLMLRIGEHLMAGLDDLKTAIAGMGTSLSDQATALTAQAKAQQDVADGIKVVVGKIQDPTDDTAEEMLATTLSGFATSAEANAKAIQASADATEQFAQSLQSYAPGGPAPVVPAPSGGDAAPTAS